MRRKEDIKLMLYLSIVIHLNKYCNTLKTFLDWSYYEGFLKSKEPIIRIKTQIKRKVKNDIVALNESELFQLLSVDLSAKPRLEKVRDVFVSLFHRAKVFRHFTV